VTGQARTDLERLLEDLNDAQRAAVTLTSGPLAIVAGAGSGKTRVISRRAAYAIETGVVRPDRILLVTFTDKAATEMVERMASLGHAGVMARTFHAAALQQLRWFWPGRHDGVALPSIVDSKLGLLAPIASRLPGHYRFTPHRDLADAIEWAKVRRIRPERWMVDGADRASIPADLFARVYADYERSKRRAGLIDFEDILVETVELLETDEDAARLVRSRKTWFSVDEYQDTNPLAERLLALWLGDSTDVAVVGDPDQTIYSFTGATSEYLLGFAQRHPGATTVALLENYRSSPQVLALANRLTAGGPRDALHAVGPEGPIPTIRRYPDDESERAALTEGIEDLLRLGIDAKGIAVLVRINAQLPELERALTAAGIPFRVRGQRFFERREVRQARRLLGRERLAEAGPALVDAIRALFVARLGLGLESDAAGDEARERAASLELLLRIAEDLAAEEPALTVDGFLAAIEERHRAEAAGSAAGVELLTYHRAKGLEWDAVFLPALEEGLLPIRQAKSEAALAEERRLLYVGITRARRHLALSWAGRRIGASGKEAKREPSRFLRELQAATPLRAAMPGRRSTEPSGTEPRSTEPRLAARTTPLEGADGRLLETLHGWRRQRARSDGVPAYVIAHDETLAAIAEARPGSLATLRRVPGMGPVRLERYGDEILAIVAGGVGHPAGG
jgi:DNA helicase II / ATP-dependent DNA helicase PcrA